jgi:hypothetical protein
MHDLGGYLCMSSPLRYTQSHTITPAHTFAAPLPATSALWSDLLSTLSSSATSVTAVESRMASLASSLNSTAWLIAYAVSGGLGDAGCSRITGRSSCLHAWTWLHGQEIGVGLSGQLSRLYIELVPEH